MISDEELREEIDRECKGMNEAEYLEWCKNKIADMAAESFVSHIMDDFINGNKKDGDTDPVGILKQHEQ